MKNIVVIAPSKGLGTVSNENLELAEDRLKNIGFNVEYSKNCFSSKMFETGTIEERVDDIHSAFINKNVDIVLTARGGANCNQILKYINYDVLKNNPKKLCGFSDITVLLNAVYAKTGIVTYLGPTFSNFAMIKGLERTIDSFINVINGKEYKLTDIDKYSDDKWRNDQINRNFIKAPRTEIINDRICEGIIIGGNLCTFCLLHGTEYMPDLTDKILFLEDDDFSGEDFIYEFDRNLQSLIHQPNFNKVKGIVFGRCQLKSDMNSEKWRQIIKTKEELKNIPIVINANFGHTTPMDTIPIGGYYKIIAKENNISIIVKDSKF